MQPSNCPYPLGETGLPATSVRFCMVRGGVAPQFWTEGWILTRRTKELPGPGGVEEPETLGRLGFWSLRLNGAPNDRGAPDRLRPHLHAKEGSRREKLDGELGALATPFLSVVAFRLNSLTCTVAPGRGGRACFVISTTGSSGSCRTTAEPFQRCAGSTLVPRLQPTEPSTKTTTITRHTLCAADTPGRLPNTESQFGRP